VKSFCKTAKELLVVMHVTRFVMQRVPVIVMAT